MQNDFITGSLGTKEAELIVDRVCEKIRSWNGEIICIQDTHNEDYLDTLEGEKLPIKHCINGTHGWKICDKVTEALMEKQEHTYQISKFTFGSFKLKKIINDDYYTDFISKEIEICGLFTDTCVVSNALILRTEFPDIPIIVNKNLCVGTTHEKHDAALEVLKSCLIDVN